MSRIMGASNFHIAPFHPYGKFPTVFIYRVDVKAAGLWTSIPNRYLSVLLFHSLLPYFTYHQGSFIFSLIFILFPSP